MAPDYKGTTVLSSLELINGGESGGHFILPTAERLRLRLHDNAGGESATKSFRIHGSFTRYAEQNVEVVHQNGRKPKRWPRWKNLKTEMFCRINLGV